MSDPRKALDYPNLNDHVWILWSGNAYRWPDARRRTSYLSRTKRHPLHGFALFTDDASDAATFATRAAAEDWLGKHEADRPQPYDVNVTTVGELKAARGYEMEA